MLKKIKLRGKIFGGFIIVLALLIAVAIVGFNGLSKVLGRSENVSHVDELVQTMLETRQYEKDFMLKGGSEAAQKVLTNINTIKKDVKDTSKTFSNKSNLELFEKVGAQVDVYQRAFSRYVDLKTDMEKTLAEMQTRADVAMKAIQDFREIQNSELVEIRSKGQASLVDQIGKTEKINDIISRIIENSGAATQLVYAYNPDKMEILGFDNEEVFRLVNELKNELKDPQSIEQMDTLLAKYQEFFDEFKKVLESTEGSKNIDDFLVKSKSAVMAGLTVRISFVAQLEKILAETDQLMDERLANTGAANLIYARFNEILRKEKEFVISKNAGIFNEVVTGLNDLLPKAKTLAQQLKSKDNVQKIEAIIGDVSAFKEAFVQYNQMVGKQSEAANEMLSAATASQNLCGEARNFQKNEMALQSDKATGMMFAGTVIAFIIGTLLAFFTARIVATSLHKVITGLTDSSEKISSASEQLAGASHSLADGSSQQAASVEETSSSLEEMAAMTKQNASHAAHADNLMQETKEIVASANNTMARLTEAMGEVSTASIETSKIIKTIDEIAFQTNLLALNAAVEAARAGEAGAGFAVVADEVRNLAIRAAESAKNTSALIDQTSNKVKESAKLVTDTESAFAHVTESATKVAQFVSEIATASNEQAQGIGQVNHAVAEMDKIIQQNVSSAEESAGATEELNSQVKQLEIFIENLVGLVGKQKESHTRQSLSINQGSQSIFKALVQTGTHGNKELKSPATKNYKITPRDVIPLDDGDLADF
jgi:methyl-accepting chemotaxis protein